MSSVIIVIASFCLFALGYRFYSKFLSSKIFELNDSEITPAKSHGDGVDFVPTKKHILFVNSFFSNVEWRPLNPMQHWQLYVLPKLEKKVAQKKEELEVESGQHLLQTKRK